MACEKINKFVNVLSIWEEAERYASGAAGSGSAADAVRRRLHTIDTY
jgi:hypothetical protein